MHYIKYVPFYSLVNFIFFVTSSYSFTATKSHEKQSHLTLETNVYEVKSGINYEYLYIKANHDGSHVKSTILFIHGFPSSIHTWRHQIEHFSRQGYGCLAINAMGYGRTYSPLSKDEYRGKLMADHILQLLNYLQLDRVIVVGHDWGTKPASRFVLYHPERALGLIQMSIAYQEPSWFDLDQIMSDFKAVCGYDIFGYWKFFETDDAASIIENNLESFIDILYARDQTLVRTTFHTLGNMREWLVNKKRTARVSYMTENDYEILRQYLVDAMQPKLNWYKAEIANIDWQDEKNLDPVLRQPFLFIQEAESHSCMASIRTGKRLYTPNVTVVPLNATHWMMEENPTTINQIMEKWIQEKL